MHRDYDVIVVGLGVSGGALLHALTRYTNVSSIAVIEKNSRPAMVNSSPLNNAQTSHDGGTETNYSLEHALEVKEAATYLRNYIVTQDAPGLYKKRTRMVLGVGADEVLLLQRRYSLFKDFYPDLRLVYADELRVIEPKVMEGRDPAEPVCALVSSEGFAVNYQILTECFVNSAYDVFETLPIYFDTDVKSIRREGDLFVLETNAGEFRTEVLVCASGAYSLLFAQQLGYGLDLGILSVAGDFYSVGRYANGKIYRPQVEGRPFAEHHLDRDVIDTQEDHFGPTTVPQPFMERYKYATFWDYIKLPIVSPRGFLALIRILFENELVGYVLENLLYRLPILGKRLVLKQLRKIVPTAQVGDVKRRKGAGGIRPQVVNLTTMKLEMGDKTIVGEKCIFNTTPSPGASVCLKNAKRDARQVVRFLGPKFWFNEEKFEAELGRERLVAKVG